MDPSFSGVVKIWELKGCGQAHLDGSNLRAPAQLLQKWTK